MVWATSLTWAGSGILAFVLSTLVMLVLRRDEQPVKFRGPWLLLVMSFGLLVPTSWLLIFLIDYRAEHFMSHEKFCDMGEWMVWLAYPAVVFPFALRAYRFWRIFRLKNIQRLADDATYWNRLVTTEGFLLRILFVILLLISLVSVCNVALDWNVHVARFGCGGDDQSAWVIGHTVEVLILFAFVWQLRDYRDDYGMGSEFRAVRLVWMLAAVAQFISSSLHEGSAVNRFFGNSASINVNSFREMNALIVIIRNLAVFIICVMHPVYCTFADPFVPLWSNCDALRSLESLLKDILCIQYFRAFLTDVGGVENILCWVELELYRDIDDEDEMDTQAGRIFDKYVHPDAELEVQVSLKLRQRIEKEFMAGPHPDMFRELQQELYILMNHDFPRFLASSYCSACLRELEREEHLRRILEQSNMI
jgi:Regulator of G protein signaling domain